ncbi:MAG: hypothetical protein IPK85_08580 [Gemmatimonadetes bacterium]|nr:hypothetical protein [Gemmatimonadota bacterium]
MRALPLAVLALSAASCRSTAPTPTGQLVSVHSVERVPISGPADTTVRARAMREGQRRAAEAAERTRLITVSPQQLTMTVGESLPFSALRIAAMDSLQQPVDGFAPNFSMQDNTIASLRGGQILALEPGTTNLRVSAATFPPSPNPAAQRPRTVLVPITVTAAALRTTVTRAPVPVDSMVPVELVRYLVNNARLSVGQPIAALDAATLRDAYVHGSLFGMGGGTTIASYPWTRRATLDSVRRRLEAAGWGPLPAPPNATELPGFQSSNMSMGVSGTAFCRQREMMALRVTEARGTETVITFSHQGAQMRGPCDPTARQMSSSAANLIPSLSALPGEPTMGGGRGGSSDDGYSEARIMSAVPVNEVIDHYARQLQAAGWTPVERTGVTGVAIATYTFRDSTARPWGGVLSVTTTPGANRTDVRLSVRHTP